MSAKGLHSPHHWGWNVFFVFRYFVRSPCTHSVVTCNVSAMMPDPAGSSSSSSSSSSRRPPLPTILVDFFTNRASGGRRGGCG